ncbi:MAG: AbrB/MazE/SpoVT family DNA-binding domain-containing protein [Micromonosporaceae bacterium]
MDANGRVADRSVVNALGWLPGERLAFEECGGLLLITADQRGLLSVSGQGYLRLSAGVRRWRGLVVGERVLLAAFRERALLVLCPAAVVEAMITRSLQAGDIP